jgi:hypothetical protein
MAEQTLKFECGAGSYLTIEIGVSSASFPVSSVWTREEYCGTKTQAQDKWWHNIELVWGMAV